MKRIISTALLLGLSFVLAPSISASDDAGTTLPAETHSLTGGNTPEPPAEDSGEEDAKEDSESNGPVTAEQVQKEIENTIQENSAEDLLNLATEIKLSADTIIDLTKTITYCTEAEKKGLSGDNLEYCRQLKISSQLERGLAMAKLFMDDSIQPEEMRGSWHALRMMALEDLEAAVKDNPELAIAQLAIGRLQMFPGGDIEKGKTALDTAIQNSGDTEQDILAESLKFRAMLEDNSNSAVEYLNRAIEINPDDPELQYLLASRLTEIYQEEKALELIEKALQTQPGKKRYLMAKADILAALGQNDEALRTFDAAFESETAADENVLLANSAQRGEFLSKLGEYDKAIELYSSLIEEKPIAILFYMRAAAYFQNHDYKNAVKDVNKTLGLDPSFEEAVRLKALIYIQEKRFGDAIPLLEKLCLAGNDEGLTSQLAYTMAQNDNFTEGMSRIDELLEKSPDSITLLRGKADMYLMYGRWTDAIAVYDKILALDPNDSGVLNNYAWLLATSPDDSIRNGAKANELALRAAEQTHYRESYILSTLAASFAEMGDFEKAREWSEKAVAQAEKEKEERIDDLRNELESYKKDTPWREAPQKTGDASDPLPPEAAEFF